VMIHPGLWMWWVEGVCSCETMTNTGARAMVAAEAAARRYVEGRDD
jgi:hypothetical protein